MKVIRFLSLNTVAHDNQKSEIGDVFFLLSMVVRRHFVLINKLNYAEQSVARSQLLMDAEGSSWITDYSTWDSVVFVVSSPIIKSMNHVCYGLHPRYVLLQSVFILLWPVIPFLLPQSANCIKHKDKKHIQICINIHINTYICTLVSTYAPYKQISVSLIKHFEKAKFEFDTKVIKWSFLDLKTFISI